jgi:hypothetical protein
MRSIEQIEIRQGKYYLAYLCDVIKYNLVLCYSAEGGYAHTTLFDVDTSRKQEYNFGSAWEIFELNEDEFNKQILMESL